MRNIITVKYKFTSIPFQRKCLLLLNPVCLFLAVWQEDLHSLSHHHMTSLPHLPEKTEMGPNNSIGSKHLGVYTLGCIGWMVNAKDSSSSSQMQKPINPGGYSPI